MYMYPEKFQLFHAISKMLREAPQEVREKWVVDKWTEVAFYPHGWYRHDSCGCCGTQYPPGWYGRTPQGSLSFIIGPDGKKECPTDSWCDVDTH
jgi:hypothetical protein